MGHLPVWHGKALRVCLHVRHLLFLKLLMYDNPASCIITFRGTIYLTALLHFAKSLDRLVIGRVQGAVKNRDKAR